LLGHFTQTAGGVRVQDVRFKGASGNIMSALLHIPPNATAQNPAPGILAVHGYINSRETQDGFAIEFARRGCVVLALDQTGHGYSDPPSVANGFGGPDGLAYLRSLDFVDKNNIGMEGHSMGGWAILAAAAAMPDGYRSMVLEGSSTGAPFAKEGSASWPRNVVLVFARYDEFSELMWGVDRGRDIPTSPKLWQVFGTTGPVEAGKLYGDIGQGTARALYMPNMTHPSEHISREAIGYSIDWFAKTLEGGTPLPVDNQIFLRKEVGTLLALIGFVAMLLGIFDMLLGLPFFSRLALPSSSDLGQAGNPESASPRPAAIELRGVRFGRAFLLSALIPGLTYYIAFAIGGLIVPASRFLPQAVTNQIVFWALMNAAITLAMIKWVPRHARRTGIVLPSILIAVVTAGAGYIALVVADMLFKVDFRFWVVSLKLVSAKQLLIFLIYVLPLTAFFVISLNVLHRNFSRAGRGAGATYLTNILSMTLGFILLLGLQYITLWTTGKLFNPLPDPGFVPLSTIIAIQFVPLLATVAIISTFTWRRTGSSLPGALICGIVVTWYIVAGTAIQVAF
jgi:pimeloyl-ACP methyl ester carboxylesterase